MLRSLRFLPVVAAFVAPVALSAQTTAAASLPAAKELITRYVTAIGGREALFKHTTMRSVGTFSMPAAGLTGDLVVTQARDGRTALTITLPGMGEIAGAYDGSVAWSINPMQGARLLEGKELAQMKEDGGFAAVIRESSGLASAETVEQTEIGGDKCYKVKMTYVSGRVSYDCYSIATGLLAGSMAVQESQMGTIETTTAVGDWKDFGGVKMPTTMKMSAMGQEQVMKITGVVFDAPDHAAAFVMPAAIKALAPAPKAP